MRTLTPVQAPARPARVCFLIDELATAGTETQLLALIRHLDRRRVRPYLVLLRGNDPRSQALEPAGCPVWRLGVRSLGRLAALLKAIRFVRFLRRERIDVLQAYFPDSSYFGVPAAWLAGVRHRVRTRNNIGHWLTPAHRFLGRVLNLFTTLTVANCHAAARALLADEGPPPDRVLVLENGVDLERFLALTAPRRRPGGRARIGAVANLRPVKGLDVLMRAVARLAPAHPGLTLHIAGEGEQRPELEQLATELGLAARVNLPGAKRDVPGFLAGLDVAVLPSRAEGMSNALLEYMAAARPLAATAVGATADVIEDGVHGLLVPPGDDVALAEALGRLLRDPDEAGRLGAAARRRAQEQYSRRAMIERFEEFYTSLISGTRSHANR
jgi:glycosyltransferase involved in cell wall biosynthesis